MATNSNKDGGYFRQPTIHGDDVVFVCESDLWSAPIAGGVARRLTAHQVECAWPRFSPDGKSIAYTATEEGATEIYIMPSTGGVGRRLTFQGALAYPCAFSRDGKDVVYASLAASPFTKFMQLWAVPTEGGTPRLLPTGPARRVAYDDHSPAVVLTRREQEIARWKRYKGGTKGDLWIDPIGAGEFHEILKDFDGNLGNPCFAMGRLFFNADHEGHGNLYSCRLDGEDLRRETNHHRYYARALASDGKRLVYQCGAELFVFDAATRTDAKIEIDYHSSKPQMQRKFVAASKNLNNFSLHPDGHSLVVTARGKAFVMANWEREVEQLGARDGVRYRFATWLPDGKRIVAVSDQGGEEALEILAISDETGAVAPPVRLTGLDFGRVRTLTVSPTKNAVVIGNHRLELVHVDLEQSITRVVDKARYEDIQKARFSPDGRYVAYAAQKEFSTTQIFIADLVTGSTHAVTPPVANDHAVTWDPDGRYLYVMSNRTFDPVYDAIVFDLGFPKGGKPYAVALRKDLESPFNPPPRPLEGTPDVKPTKGAEKVDGDGDNDAAKVGSAKTDSKPITIDFDGIEQRIVEFPVPESRYGAIAATKTKIFFTESAIEGALSRNLFAEQGGAKLHYFDLETQKMELFAEGINAFNLSRDGKTIALRIKDRLRVVKTSAKPDAKETKNGRTSGFIDLDRIRLSIVPRAEWGQMLREMWRLQRDHFWDIALSKVDWNEVYERYLPILDRVATRAEFSDLAWEVQGELGTSHAYEMGGDYRHGHRYTVGHLGAALVPENGGLRVKDVVRGDPWDRAVDSPLAAMGVNVVPGDVITSIDGVALTGGVSEDELLVHKAGVDVALAVRSADGRVRKVVVKPLGAEMPLRYRRWVEDNRAKVHAATGGRIGYVHIPDMGARGYAEFFRYYPLEYARGGMIVDVRFNGGGHVSQILLEKLARQRLSYMVSHHIEPVGEPLYAVDGPIIAVTNEFAGSDGDIFCHEFKMLKLGTLIGKRTWGGVVGIDGRNSLVDGTKVTQPEYAAWFKDVGWRVENYGTDPDIEVDIAPQDHAQGRDPQLEKAVALALAGLAKAPVRPDFKARPDLRRQTLI